MSPYEITRFLFAWFACFDIATSPFQGSPEPFHNV